MAQITKLYVENFKAIKAVSIELAPGVTEISGKNAAGKSACLDSIYAAFGGAAAVPPEALRRGTKKGEVEITLDDPKIIIRRKFLEDGSSAVTVESYAGERATSPQRVLDELWGKIAMDPAAFARMKPAERVALLLKLIDFSADPAKLQLLAPDSEIEDPIKRLDVRADTVFKARTDENRVLVQLEAELAAIEAPKPDDPKTHVSVPELMRERDAIIALRTSHRVKKAEAENLRAKVAAATQEIDWLKKKIADLEEIVLTAGERAEDLEQEIAAAPEDTTDEIDEKIENAEGINERLAAIAKWTSLMERRNAQKVVCDGMTKRLEAIKAYKEELLAGAKMPIAGLGYSAGEDVTFEGFPFEQASQAQRIRVSAAIAAALNPKLKVMLVRDGSLLDDESMQVLADFAAEKGFQVLVETVDTSGKVGVVITAGEVTAVNPPRFKGKEKDTRPKSEQLGKGDGGPVGGEAPF